MLTCRSQSSCAIRDALAGFGRRVKLPQTAGGIPYLSNVFEILPSALFLDFFRRSRFPKLYELVHLPRGKVCGDQNASHPPRLSSYARLMVPLAMRSDSELRSPAIQSSWYLLTMKGHCFFGTMSRLDTVDRAKPLAIHDGITENKHEVTGTVVRGTRERT